MTATEYRTIRAMLDRGGSFVQALAHAMISADPDNLARIKAAFPEIMRRYAPGPLPEDIAHPFGPDHHFQISPDQVGM